MPLLYYLNVAIHVFAAMLWLGGMFFLGIVGAPLLRALEPEALRQRLFQALGYRFRRVGWISIAVLLVTGVMNVHYRGWLHWQGMLGSARFWSTPAGHALAAKLILVVVMLAGSALHDFHYGPRAGLAEPGSAEAVRLRRQAAILARVNAFLGVMLLVAATVLARVG